MKDNLNTLEIKKVIHYGINDKDCISDHYAIELFVNDERVRVFRDWQYEGGTRCESFIEGIEHIYGGNVEIEVERIADGKDWTVL